MGKREIARYEQFLLFPVFPKGLFPRGVKGVIVWKWVNCIFSGFVRLVENIVQERENAGHQHFSAFPAMFSKSAGQKSELFGEDLTEKCFSYLSLNSPENETIPNQYLIFQ